MLSYVTLVNLTVLKLLLLFCYYLSRTKLKPISIVFVLIAIIVISLVYYSGIVISHDSVVYYIPYYNDDSWRSFEPGYFYINEIFKFLGFDAEEFILCMSLLTFSLFSYGLYKLTDDFTCFTLSLFIVFSTLSFNFFATGLLRQYIAFVLVFTSIVFFVKDKNKFYYLFLIIASMVHFSSIIYFGAIKIKKISFKNKLYLVLISFLLAIFSKSIVNVLTGLLPLVSDNVYLKSITRVLGYSDKNIVHDAYIIKYSFVFLCMLSMGLYYNYFHRLRNSFSLKTFETVYSFALCGFLLASLSYFSSEASIRILYGVVVLNACAFGVLLKFVKFRFKDLIVGLTVFIIFIYSFFSHQWITDFVNRYI